ncbi:hypothetical protein AB1E18_019367 [Capra hircus]
MSSEKGAPFGYPLWDRREWRGKPQRAAKGRDKARCQGARGQARTFGRSQLEPGSRGAQKMRETLWMPWNGLIVIGRKMELLGRKTQKPKTWDLKLESENWRLEDVEKTVLRGKSGRSPERMDVKRVRSVSSALQVSAGLRKDISKEMWGKQEFRHRVEAESESAGTVAGSRKGPEFKEKLKFTDVETSGEVLRARGYERRSSTEKQRSSREKLGTSGEKLVHSRMGNINEEQIEKVVEVIGDEKLIEITNAEMEIPFESVEANDEENEEGVEEEEDILEEENYNSDESVSMEEKAIIEEEGDEVSEEMDNVRRKEEQIGKVLQVKEEKLE